MLKRHLARRPPALAALGLLAVGLTACDATRLPPGCAAPDRPGCAEALTALLERHRVPAVSVAVVDGSAVVDAWTVGEARPGVPATPATRFQAASVSKPVAAAVALALVDRGALDLDADVAVSLTSWTLPRGPERGAVSLRRLLSHTAGVNVPGFGGYRRGRPVPTLFDVLDGRPPATSDPVRVVEPPGRGCRYSGGGYTVVQQLVADAAGRPFAEAARDLVLRPLAMDRSTFAPLDPAAPDVAWSPGHDGTAVPGGWHAYPESAAAGLWTTPTDLARFVAALVRPGRGGGEALSPEAAAAMTTEHA